MIAFPLLFKLTHTHTHSLSLSVTHTYTHRASTLRGTCMHTHASILVFGMSKLTHACTHASVLVLGMSKLTHAYTRVCMNQCTQTTLHGQGQWLWYINGSMTSKSNYWLTNLKCLVMCVLTGKFTSVCSFGLLTYCFLIQVPGVF